MHEKWNAPLEGLLSLSRAVDSEDQALARDGLRLIRESNRYSALVHLLEKGNQHAA